MRRTIARLCATVALAVSVAAGPALARAPACGGRDLAEELKTQAPDSWSAVTAAAATTKNGNAVFFRVQGKAAAPSYLFGTIHLTDDRIVKLPPAVETALSRATTVALEIADLSPEGLAASFMRLQPLLVYADGRSLTQLLSGEEKSLAEKSLEKAGMPAAAIAALKPWVVTMTMSLSDCERQRTAAGLKPLDLLIGERAKQRGVPLVGLETIEDQLRAMAAVPDADQLTVLKASLKLYDLTDDMLETMVRRYGAREIGVVWPLQEALWRRAGFEPWAFHSFRRELVTIRNVKMRDAALPLLEAGGAFIAVGALHLPGDDGLVELLRQAGYKVDAAE